MPRFRTRLGIRLAPTWFFGYQVHRTYLAPWSHVVEFFIVPGLCIGYRFGWIGSMLSDAEPNWRRWVPL